MSTLWTQNIASTSYPQRYILCLKNRREWNLLKIFLEQEFFKKEKFLFQQTYPHP